MPEKGSAGGWRKRIHSRPGPTHLNPEDSVLADADTESLRPPSERSSWRSTFHSRPGTPSRAPTPTTFQFDTEDVRREMAPDVPSPRKATKPKLARYLSGYLSIKDASREPDFAEPWNERPSTYTVCVDPMVSLQSVFSHMTSNPSRPIPLHYNSSIFRVFEDYRKIRDEKERLDNLLHETFEGYRAAERFYEKAEAEYQAEVRRLELLIARGASGMTGLMRARRDSTVKRARTHRKTVSYDHAPTSSENVPAEKLDEQILMRSQQVLLQRPVSPSEKMAILSRRLENIQSVSDFVIGTPPTQERNVTLSRKVQSELNLARLVDRCMDGSVPRSLESAFSGNGDPLPDEVESRPVLIEPVIDQAFVALQELGTLVATKRGINTQKFLEGLMQLFSMAPVNSEHAPDNETHGEEASTGSLDPTKAFIKRPSTPEHVVRHIHSQPQLGSAQRCRRHFSFEPGDDQVTALERKLKAHEAKASSNSDEPDTAFDETTMSSLRSLTYNADMQKPSKIPSPIQPPGLESVRRKSSNSSLRTLLQRPETEERRDSQSSVLTAFRQNSSGSLRPVTQSRSSSGHTLRHSEGYSTGTAGVRRNIAAMAAARAVDQADNSVPKSNPAHSASISPALGSSARASLSEKAQMENALPREHL